MITRRKLIEVALPLKAINEASAREKSIRHGHPSTLHLWWARRPLAACRAVLFGQLVDDPSAWPDLFPNEEAQDRERKRLFALIEELVQWENSTNERVIGAARLEIARSIARGRKADGVADGRDEAVLRIAPTAEPNHIRDLSPEDRKVVDAYLAEVAPPVHDPFAGGGSIPLEAQRLGLRAIATDLNPVAVLINKALIEIPPKFAGRPPVNPEARGRRETVARTWKGAQGLAEDVRYYGRWMRDEAHRRIGHLYPPVKVTEEMAAGRPDLKEYVGKELTVIAWLWARTVASPNPACGGAHVPLVSSFWLSKKPGKEAWVEPVVDRAAGTWRFEVRVGRPADPRAVEAGTKTGRGSFRCLLTGDPIPPTHVQAEGKAGRMRDRLMAIVAEGQRGRVYLDPLQEHEQAARLPPPGWTPDFEFAKNSRHMTPWVYGLDTFAKLFTPRQLTALVTFSDLVAEARERALADALAAGMPEGEGLEAGGSGARAYGEAVATYVAFATDRLADKSSALSWWMPIGDKMAPTLCRNALAMVWNFAEMNAFCSVTSNFEASLEWVSEVIDEAQCGLMGQVGQADATESTGKGSVFCMDPPYYDNVPYGDLSDFFYVWLRRSLRTEHPRLLATLLVPKAQELIAEPFRHGGRAGAEHFFVQKMFVLLGKLAMHSDDARPTTIFYAFKQSETGEDGTSSTGWETFLKGVIESGLAVSGTLPIRTERSGGLRELGRNSLASSIVLVCRKRPQDAPTITRADFRRLLRSELPAALKALQHGNIAPVDMAQASIGPGMAIFSRHAKVLEADGTPMTVRTALQLINQALDEYLAEQEGEFDTDTRFALTWFETRAYETGPFGEAETLAKARNVSVAGVVEAGILHAAAGKVSLLRRDEMPDDWNPETDKRLTVWEATQHLIKRLETKGEQAAADLLARLGARAAPARDLAYRLYTTCERKGWAEEGRSYNGLVVSWPELEKLAAARTRRPTQGDLL
ncbi:DUF1156 domain-containing protein [Myxococcota bacterium]|nr:DUF1156 domain-containing protein [Myxococcota bacterium]